MFNGTNKKSIRDMLKLRLPTWSLAKDISSTSLHRSRLGKLKTKKLSNSTYLQNPLHMKAVLVFKLAVLTRNSLEVIAILNC